jgi:NNP family nitrate/nitrite transporter-like MFS transporter
MEPEGCRKRAVSARSGTVLRNALIPPGGTIVDRVRGTPNEGLLGATLGFFVGFASVSLFGPTAQRFQEAMALSPVLVGLLVAAPALSGSLLRIPFGAWVDTTGGRRPFLVLLILSFAGMTGLLVLSAALYPDRLTAAFYPLVIFLGVLSGCGIATFSVGIGQVSYWFPTDHQGRALATYAGLGNIAPGLFAFLLPISLTHWGLAGSYLAWLVLLGVGIGVYYVMGLNAPYFQLRAQGVPAAEARRAAEARGQQIFPAGGAVHGLGIAARIWKTWALVFIYFTTFGGFIALTAWFPTYWVSFFGVSLATAGILTAVYSVGASIIRVPGGVVADRLGGEITAIGSLLVTLAGALLLTLSHRYDLSVAGTILMAIGMGVANAAVFKLVPQEVREAVGGAAGWVGGLGAFGGFAIPPLLGTFVRIQGSTGYATGFVTFVLLAAASLAVALALRATRARNR